MSARPTSILKAVLALSWIGLLCLVLVNWCARPATIWKTEHRTLHRPGAPALEVHHPDVARAADRGDGAMVHVQRTTILSRNRTLVLIATSMRYSVDSARGINDHYIDEGPPEPNSYFEHGLGTSRLQARFPLTEFLDFTSINAQRTYKPSYSYTRTEDTGRSGRDLEIRAPFWLLASILALPLPTIVAFKGWRHLRSARRRRRERCERCNYDLRASKDRCPECGHPIPNSNPAPPTPPAS